MIGNDLEQSIIGLYADNLKAGYTILQIAKLLGKAYPYINKKANEFIAQGIFLKAQIGKSYLCTLNLKSPQAIVLLTIHQLRLREATAASDPTLDAIIGEIAALRGRFGIICAAQFGKEIAVVGDPILQERMRKEAPLLAAHQLTVLTAEQFALKARLGQASLVLWGIELYYTLLGESG